MHQKIQHQQQQVVRVCLVGFHHLVGVQVDCLVVQINQQRARQTCLVVQLLPHKIYLNNQRHLRISLEEVTMSKQKLMLHHKIFLEVLEVQPQKLIQWLILRNLIQHRNQFLRQKKLLMDFLDNKNNLKVILRYLVAHQNQLRAVKHQEASSANQN